MAYMKHKGIHTTPREHLKYILNPDKNENMKYCTAICCTNDYTAVCEDFKELYEMFAENKFDNYTKRKKENIRIHSYIQSFDESVSPELAHQIGVEWAKAMFGENRPVIVVTHTNTGHCHNHFAVCPYDVKGNMWFADKKTYEIAREVSDRICLEHGLCIIENPKKRSSLNYKEWDARKKGYSWKVKMADVIDKLIISDDVTDIASLIEKMREYGYVFTNEKRLIAKPSKVKYGCSIAKLGYGYSVEMLQMRIANKQNEFVGKKISAYLGIQVEYAVTIREKQTELYRSRPLIAAATYAEVKRTSELLCYITENHIHSVDDMKAVAEKAEAKTDKLYRKYSFLEKQEKLLELLEKYGDEYDRLLNDPDRNEYQQKRFEELYKILVHGGFIGYDCYSSNWLPKLKQTLQQQIGEKKNVLAQISKASNEYNRVSRFLSDLKSTLETDYDKIRKREQLRIQIEKYHEGLEPQEDGTFKAEETPTCERNAELAYLARLEEKRLRDEEERRIFTERQAREKRRERDYYSR